MFSIRLHIAVYVFYRACMQDSSLCEVRRKIASCTTPLQIFLVLMSHASLNHTLCLCAFCSCSSDPVSTRLWLWLLKVRIHCIYLLITLAAGNVHTYVRRSNGTDVSVHDPFSICVVSVHYPFDICDRICENVPRSAHF